MSAIRFLFTGVMLLGIVGCNEESIAQSEINDCYDRGVAYFKEIDSYPTLHSEPNVGRYAVEIARERCNRTTTAFPKR